MNKEYALGEVTYSFSRIHRKWKFTVGGNTLLIVCPGGKQTADKIAKHCKASYARNKGKQPLDGIARKAIDTVLKPVTVD